MGTSVEKLAYLKETKRLIKEAIKAKGQSVSDTATFRSYADKIRAITTSVTHSPSISVSTAGKITATCGGTSATKQLTTQAAKTVTPGTSGQTAVSSGVYTTGTVTVAGDSDLVASNIKKGVSIFNVTGTYSQTPVTEDGTVTMTRNGSYYYCTFNTSKTIGTLCSFYAYLEDSGNTYNVAVVYDAYNEKSYFITGYTNLQNGSNVIFPVTGTFAVFDKSMVASTNGDMPIVDYISKTSSISYIPA